VVITKADADRVWGWPLGTKLLDHVTKKGHEWLKDPPWLVEWAHGGGMSFREPDGCHPAMQIIFHPQGAGHSLEIDIDESAPVDVVSAIWHGEEVLTNFIGHKLTDQSRIAELLDKRFGVQQQRS
jgi:hypothetical protein